jgi:hypothetical protein
MRITREMVKSFNYGRECIWCKRVKKLDLEPIIRKNYINNNFDKTNYTSHKLATKNKLFNN